MVLVIFQMLLLAVGAVLSTLRYRSMGDTLVGYVAITQVAFSFVIVAAHDWVRFSPLWYLSRTFGLIGVAASFFDLLLEYITLYRRAQEKSDELMALQRVTDPKLGGEGLERLICSLLDCTVDIMNADSGGLMLLDSVGKELVLKSAVGIPGQKVVGFRMGVGQDLVGRVAEQITIIWVRDLQVVPDLSVPPMHPSFIRGMIGVPLAVQGGVIGIIFIAFRRVKAFTRYEEHLVSVVAERAVQAIYQARLLQDEHQARLEAEQAVQTRDRLMEAMAHELKTPITNLRGYAQLSLRRLSKGQPLGREQVHQTLVTIDQQSARLHRLAQQLLDLASIDAGQLRLHRKEVDLVRLVRGLVESTQARTRRHTLSLQTPNDLRAFVDPIRFELVVANLLDNAIKLGKPEVPIEVKIAIREPNRVCLSVHDYGPGIAEDRREGLSSKLYQADTVRPFAGLGLGLYYSRHIVELHGGQIGVQFPPEGGGLFIVSLPLVSETEDSAEA